MLKEKPDVKDESQENRSKKTDNRSSLENVVHLNTVGCAWNFDSDREAVESIVVKSKNDDEQFKKLMNRCIAGWDIGKSCHVDEKRSEALKETNKC